MSAVPPMSLKLAAKSAGEFVSLFSSVSRLSEVIDVAVRAEADENSRNSRVAALAKREAELIESVGMLATKEAEAHAAATAELAAVKETLAERLAMTTASAKEQIDGCRAECDAMKNGAANDLEKSKAIASGVADDIAARTIELAEIETKIASAREAMRKLLA